MKESTTERICNYHLCDNDISHLVKTKKYCCEEHKTNQKAINYEAFKAGLRAKTKQKKQYTCIVCNKNFESHKHDLITCSRKCNQTHTNNKTRELKRAENNHLYRDVHDIPTCIICGWKSRSLQGHLKNHKLTVDQYRTQFNLTNDKIFHSSYIEEKSENVSGKNNPGYNHDGTKSSFSKKFKKYEGLDDEERQRLIDVQIKKANESKKQNNSYTTTIEYYTSKGLSIFDARRMVHERQKTFSLDICIAKYGQEQGLIVWKARQDKWITALNLLSDEEKERIYQLKRSALGRTYSHIATEMFKKLNITDSYYGANEVTIKTSLGVVRPDFVWGKKIIEFYGDYWHANPNIYFPDDEVKLPKHTNKAKVITAMELWIKDEARVLSLIAQGYDVLVIWESDYRYFPEETIHKCLNFLQS